MKPTIDAKGSQEIGNYDNQALLTASDKGNSQTQRSASTLSPTGKGGVSPRPNGGAGATRVSIPGLDLAGMATAPPPQQQEVYVTKYGYVSARRKTSAVPFGNAIRPSAQPVGSAATVPFHYMPPAFDERDPNADIKNAGYVPFTTSTRDQWDAVHNAAQSSATAGPGSYDTERADEHISGKRSRHGVSFVMGEREVLKPFITPCGLDYKASEQLEKYLLRQSPRMPFTTAVRQGMKGIPGPAPADTRSAFEATMGKHSYAYKFSGAPAHEKPLVNDLATAAVPFYGGDRPKRKPTVGMPFGRAPRIL